MKNRVKKSLSLLLAVIMMICAVPVSKTSLTAKAVTMSQLNDSSVFLKQAGSTTCTLCATTMMLRRYSMLRGDSNWNTITESSVRSPGWINGQGLRWSFTYSNSYVSSISVGHGTLPGGSSNASTLIEMLKKCPEGIVIYNTSVPHAVLLTDYTDGVFYCADPLGSYPSGRIPLTSAYKVRINNVTAYWKVTSPVVPGPTTHTHSYYEHYEAAHPHKKYMKCSCGEWYYTGKTTYVDSCIYCNMPGKSTILNLRDRYASVESVSFTWSETANTTHYNLVIEKMKENGSYEYYYRKNFASSGLTLKFEPGYYEVTVQSYNSNYYYEDGSDWIHTISDKYHFSVEYATPGKSELKNMKDVYMAGDSVSFTWSETANTTHYNLEISKMKEDGSYEFYYRKDFAPSGLTLTFEPGYYEVIVQSYNSNYYYEDGSDWLHTISDKYHFSVEDPTPGKSELKNMKNVYMAGENVSFTWSKTKNTTHYNLEISKMKEDGSYEFYYRKDFAPSGLTLTFEPGYYEVIVQSYNSNYYYEDGSDWLHTISDKYHFSVEKTTPEQPETPSGKCNHLCHKGGFLWSIVRFFWKLFRTNKYCSCGAAHY